MREDKIAIKVNRLLVVLRSLGEFATDKVQLSTVVIDIRVIGVLADCGIKVASSSFSVAWNMMLVTCDWIILRVYAYPAQVSCLPA